MSFLVTDLARNLHDTNSRLSFWLELLAPQDPSHSARARPATPDQMAGLLSELMRAGEWLRALPADRDAALEKELAAYRTNVTRLRELLPSIHSALLRERACLEQRRARLESSAESAHRSRQIV